MHAAPVAAMRRAGQLLEVAAMRMRHWTLATAAILALGTAAADAGEPIKSGEPYTLIVVTKMNTLTIEQRIYPYATEADCMQGLKVSMNSWEQIGADVQNIRCEKDGRTALLTSRQRS